MLPIAVINSKAKLNSKANIKAKETPNKTNKKMMILSFIGIIMVVIGHTNNQIEFANKIFPIYSFHMPLFIFISGYFYNPKYEANVFGIKGYIVKKLKKLVLPYFIWNVVYGVLITIVKKLNIVLYGNEITLYSFFIKPWITGHQYHLNIASWFLLSLFLVNIVYIIIRKIFSKIKIWNDYVCLLILFIASLCGVYFSKLNLGDGYIPLFRTLFFIFFYHFGYIYKTKIENKVKINTTLYIIILILINLVLLKIGQNLEYHAVFMRFYGRSAIVHILASITGILFYLKISEILEPALANSKIVNYISNNTFNIMMHHLFYIFIVNVIIYKLSGVLDLSGFDVEKFKSTIYYCYTPGVKQFAILYTILGVAMPLVMKYYFDKLKKRVLKI